MGARQPCPICFLTLKNKYKINMSTTTVETEATSTTLSKQ